MLLTVNVSSINVVNQKEVSPKQLFLESWQVIKANYYSKNLNKQNWARWKRRYINKIKTQEDAYIAIKKEYIHQYPNLFPPKQTMPTQSTTTGRPQRHNDSVEVIWDDGTTMECLLEGNQEENGIVYPKQIASAPSKAVLGEYIRNRIGVPSGARVTRRDLTRYGRDYT